MSRQIRAQETRTHIMGAATICFARAGYDATGVAEICKQAGVSKGAFYHHFPSKQTVFLELITEWLGGLDAQLRTTHIAAPTVPERLLEMTAIMGQVFEIARDQVPLFLEFLRVATREPGIWQATVAPFKRYRELFASFLQTGVAEGTLQPIQPDLGAQVIVSLAVGVLVQGVLDPQGGDWGLVMRDGVTMLLQGIQETHG